MLARGAAVLLVAGVSAGCSSDLMRFDHGVTASTAATQPVYDQQMQTADIYQNPQPYPGDTAYQAGALDQTTTASINRGGIRPRAGGIANDGPGRPVPSVNVGAANTAPRQPYPQQQMAAVQPFPATPRPTGQVIRQPIGQPAAPSANIDRTVTGSIQQLPAPNDRPKTNTSQSTTERQPPPASPKPADRVAVLPQPTRITERDNGQAGAKPARTVTTGAVYTVVAGDTLGGIAQKTGSSANAIKQANGLDSVLIRIGQKLVIPGANVQASAEPSLPQGVDPIVTGSVAAPKPAGGYIAPKPQNAEIEKMVEHAAAAPDATGIGRLRWPVHGRVVSGFGSQIDGRRNDGIDIAVPEGTPVKAAENGVIIYAGDGLKDFGNTVLVRHENGLVTVYGHNSEIIVERGATVRRGQEIARSGVSGNAGSPKLHFEVRKESSPVDPGKFLE